MASSYKDSNDNNVEALIDDSTHTAINIHYEHHEVHIGNHYYITGFDQIDTNAEIVFGVTAPDTDCEIHVTTLINGTSQIEIYIYENSVFTGGTPVVAINNNRRTSNTSDATLVLAPTVSDVGDLISSQSAGKAGVNPTKGSGGLTGREQEIVLKRNTSYIFKTISKDDDNIISFRADWYENGIG